MNQVLLKPVLAHTVVQRAYSNASLALVQLKDFTQQSTGSRRDKAAVIQAFEFTFETFWKLFQKIAAQLELETAFPRLAIAGAYKLNIIQDEDLWIKMNKDRNETSHSYNEPIADRIYADITAGYIAEYERVLEILNKCK